MFKCLLRQSWVRAQALRTNSVRNYAPRGRNPGIERRMKLFEKDPLQEELEDMDELESDFLNVHHSHKDVEKELAIHKEKLGYWIVKNKYFKSNNINLLTYSEKEQIRHLHDSDREEWTFEKLAASFPATEETIQKIIKAKWLNRDSKRIEKHDLSVQKNWDALREDKVPGIPEELRKHLLKFADREIDPHQREVEANRDHLKLPTGEFSNIITSCKKITSTTKLAIKSGVHGDSQTHPAGKLDYGSNTMVLEGVTDRRPMTIELFRDSSGILQSTNNPQSSVPAKNTPQYPNALGSRTAKVEMAAVPSQFEAVKPSIQFRDRITIPRKLRRPGATYKVEDSYFDDDGEFLYRVPGMTK